MKALIYFVFAAEAAELSAAYGDFGERFYNSLESSAEKFLNYAKLHPDFFSLHEAEFENLIATADPLGYGVSDDLRYMIEDARIEVLFQGKRVSYNPDLPSVSLASMFGYIINAEGSIQVANRIFEMRLYNLFLAEEELTNALYDKAQGNKFQFINGDRLDMNLVIEKFVLYFQDIYGESDEKFLEEQGRKLFLLYLKPIINGTVNYYIEAQTRDARRTDVIVDYLGEQFIIEFKIWYGNEYNERGIQQLADYLDYYHKDRGYMISFNFNKKAGIQEISIREKTIVEAVV